MQTIMNPSFFDRANHSMLVSQLMPNKITRDKILQAFASVPRELFAPKKAEAYSDAHLFWEGGRFMLSPMVQAQLFSVADFKGARKILDVGCARGYSSALLCVITGADLVGLDSDEKLLKDARLLCKSALFELKAFNGEDWQWENEFDLIFVEGAISSVPDAYRRALKEGGKFYAIEQNIFGSSFITCRVKKGCHFEPHPILEAFAPILWEPPSLKNDDHVFSF